MNTNKLEQNIVGVEERDISNIDDVKNKLQSHSYLDYFESIQYIIRFVKGFVSNKDDYNYENYKEFAHTVIKLLSNIIDDYMEGNIKLWRSKCENNEKLTQYIETLRRIRSRINNAVATDTLTQCDVVYDDLLNFLETHTTVQ